jgi:endonuclease G, mitochondrial
MKPPESIAAAARARVQGAQDQRDRVSEATAAGQPLDAEPSESRKVNRIQAVTGVTREGAVALASYAEPTSLGLAGERRLAAERIQGRTTDFVGASFLERAIAASSAVGRVAYRNGQPLGSGFMISDRLFLTNNHVIPDAATATELLVEFKYELDVDDHPKPVTRFALDPDAFFVTNSEDDLDFTVVAIGRREAGSGDLSDFGYCPPLATDDKHILGEFINVIQHPEGDYKQVVLRENQLVARLKTVLHYVADTQPGSSGSPVFNDQWEVIALHHWGEPFTQVTLPDGRPAQKDVNEGIRVSAIVAALEAAESQFTGIKRDLLRTALRPLARHATAVPNLGHTNNAVVDTPARPLAPPRPAVDEGTRREPETSEGRVTWTIPIEVSVRIGTITGPGAVGDGRQHTDTTVYSSDQDTLGGEAIRPDLNYANRRGYNPAFLPGHRLRLPRLTTAQRARAARNLGARPGTDPYELKYQHFSLVMNADRRMAYFTAVNIDGSKWRDVDRTSGQPRESAEATELWFDDPRVDPRAVCEQGLYDDQRPRRVFDRGHLVRRQDPGWGTEAQAARANADTFHFTNCTPQQLEFNERAQYWQGIENYVLNNATAEEERVTVLTGPVFAANDPTYRYVKVPMRFWKIVVRVDGGELLATALMADQTARITRMPELLREKWDNLGKVAQYQTTVAEIERLTGLDFGPLRDHDTADIGAEALGAEKAEIRSFQDIRLDRPSAARGAGNGGSIRQPRRKPTAK